MLIFFGNPLEQRLGARGFWKIFVGGVIGGSLLAALVGRLFAPDVPLSGAAARDDGAVGRLRHAVDRSAGARLRRGADERARR